MSSHDVDYTAATRKKDVAGREVTILSLNPVFGSDEERQKARQYIQDGLYRIFSKHMG